MRSSGRLRLASLGSPPLNAGVRRPDGDRPYMKGLVET